MSDFSDIVGFLVLLSDKKKCQMSEFCRIFSKKRIFVGFVNVLDFPFLLEKDFQTSEMGGLFSC